MVHHGSVSDIIWYSRFAVLVGALVLLVQAIAGRAAGFVTLLAVILLCVGLVVFVVALGLQGLRAPAPDTGAASSGDEPMTETTPDTDPPPERGADVTPTGASVDTDPAE